MPHSLGELGAMLFGFTLLFFTLVLPLYAAFNPDVGGRDDGNPKKRKKR